MTWVWVPDKKRGPRKQKETNMGSGTLQPHTKQETDMNMECQAQRNIPAPTYAGSVYLSGPITGMKYEDARFGWRQKFALRMKPGIKVLSPMRHEGHLAEVKDDLAKEYPVHFFSGARVLVEKDRLDIKRSEVMVVNLLKAIKVSIGTVAEIGMAYEMGKTIVLVMEDEGNVHDHPFVTVPAALRLNNLDDAIEAVNSLMSEGV